MIYEIFNDKLKVQISSVGAELQSMIYDGAEYLWQGDPTYWHGRAYNLFPICGRLTDGKYYNDGNTYEMNLHGFIRKSELDANKLSDNEIEFIYKSNDESKKIYPFDFVYHIKYTLAENSVKITNQVDCLGNKVYFSIGGHPGFNVPLDNDAFEDYYVDFSGAKPNKIVLSPTCFITDDREPMALDGNKLWLKHDLFDNDAIFMEDIKSPVILASASGNRKVTLDFEKDMKYLGLWHTPKTDAPFVCIEPWTGLPSYDGVVDDFKSKKNITKLTKGEKYVLNWSITLD